jgi:hypothetical protein
MANPMKRACSVLYFIQMMSLTPTVCCRSGLDCCSFRRCYPFLEGYHCWGPSRPCSESFRRPFVLPVPLGAGHHRQKESSRTYSPAPFDYPRLHLFSFDGETSYFNPVFWLVYDDATTWQSSSSYGFLPSLDCGGH